MKLCKSNDLILTVLLTGLVCYSGICVLPALYTGSWTWVVTGVLSLTAACFAPIVLNRGFPTLRLRFCHHGYICLTAFLISCFFSVVMMVILALRMLPDGWKRYFICVAVCVAVHITVYIVGIVCVYLTSVQLGIKYRAALILLGWLPIVNLVILSMMITTVRREVYFESEKELLNASRKERKICRTKYPILLVHGVCFRDTALLNYWGRVPAELIKNGATVFYGNQQSAASVENCAKEIKHRILSIIEQTGCDKVNIIAHSKGGLDSRYAISCLGMAPYVASLTTINTPHRGCEYADYLLDKISSSVQERVGSAYNSAMKKLGDHDPDFIAAMNDLSADGCAKLNEMINDDAPGGILRQSYGSCINHITCGRFPFNLTYGFIKHFEGENDGLVSEKSFAWGESYELIKIGGRHGISHVDIIDLYRENIRGFDAREFYVNIVSELKEKGL